jgi:outer membrane autotransporter protein
LRRYALFLLSFLAGFLFSNPVQADPILLADGPGANLSAPTGPVTVDGSLYTGGPFTGAIYMATNGGAITGVGDLTLTVNDASGNKVFYATGAGSRITMKAGTTEIIIHNIPGSIANGNDNNRVFYAHGGGQMELENITIISNDVSPAIDLTNRALESDGIGSHLRATNTTIHMTGDSQVGAEVFGVAANQQGGVMELFNTNITVVGKNSFGLTNTYGTRLEATDTFVHMTGDNNGIVQANSSEVSLTNFEGTLKGNKSQVFGAFVGSATGARKSALLEAVGATITVEGDYNRFVYASTGATTRLENSTISGTGINNYGLASRSTSTGSNAAPSTITLLNTSVTSLGSGSSAAFVNNGSKLEIGGSKSIIEGSVNGIVITADANVLANGTNLVSLTNQSLLKNLGVGDGEAAFKVGGADANITVTDSTVESGRTLLYVNDTQIPLPVAPPGPPPTPGTHSSVVNLTGNGATLNGDILVDASSTANVVLEHNSVLTGAVNENQLTGASGINPNEPAVNLPPQTVNLSVDGTSTWNIRASSTLDTLDVSARAHVSFADPPADPFKTLVMNNLTGTGGIFTLNNDLAAIKGDLINILNTSQGGHLVLFNNRTAGSDLPVDTALLVVKTTDGHAVFGGEEDGGTFLYFVRRGNGSNITPVTTDWYLVRGDEITTPSPSPSPSPRPSTSPSPRPSIPPDVLPPNILPPGPISPIDDLTAAANAAIGTFSATMPLFYADMDTLVQRLGELRLLAQAPPAAPPTGLSKEDGKGIVTPPPPEAPPAGGGIWFRGFGSGSHINDQVSRSFDQNLGGFQIGADKRFITGYGDLYLGVFSGYFHAHRDFADEFFGDATGNTDAFSVGAYGTFIHPSGFYADLVLKYTQLWNDFDAPNFLSFLGLGPTGTAHYSIPTFGASLEVGKRWDFGHFFLEPQGQIEGAGAGGADYTVSTGLRVSADSQSSLRGRLGVRAGLHFDWGSRAFEPYAKVSATNEFLGGDRITTDRTAFSPTLSGVGIQAAGGVTARMTDSTYLYAEYDYVNSDKIRSPWGVNAGFRWEW